MRPMAVILFHTQQAPRGPNTCAQRDTLTHPVPIDVTSLYVVSRHTVYSMGEWDHG